MKKLSIAAVLTTLVAVPSAAHAFCGFYVSGAESSLYANATMVVMMREGTRTVLSMQNNYQGPPQDFAMVVPVPVVLQEENVKTLPREIFQRVDSLASPRLVEYWEQDPCQPPMVDRMAMPMASGMAVDESESAADDGDTGVVIEAQFAVAEYDIVILSARDSGGLDRWLRQNSYNIPAGAGEVLRPYVEQGTKFFVAKVDVERVTFEGGQAVLSPLRVHYDSQEFSLPVRLGLLNSDGQQDLLVHILARAKRFEVANYENVTIPTNIRVVDAVRQEFGGFYEALFRQTVASNPRSVVTEYSWDASSCDPCPTPAMNPQEIATLGADVLGNQDPWGFVLTRLHYRYTPQDLGEDLVFREAGPIVGGRGTPDQEGEMQEEGAQPGQINNFQGRYIILNRWEGEIACDEPQRGMWGGPPGGGAEPQPMAAGSRLSGGASQPSGNNLGVLVAEDIPEIGVVAGQSVATPSDTRVVDRGPMPQTTTDEGGCASCSSTGSAGGAAGAFLIGIATFLLLRRRRREP